MRAMKLAALIFFVAGCSKDGANSFSTASSTTSS